MKKLQKRNSLSIERIRKCEKFKNATDEQALEVIHSLERLALILYEHWRKATEAENQQEPAPCKISVKKNHKLGGTCDKFVALAGNFK